MTSERYYPAVFYYEDHPSDESLCRIVVTFPDFLQEDFPAFTSGMSVDDAIQAAEEKLAQLIAQCEKREQSLPEPSPVARVQLDSEPTLNPFRIEIMQINQPRTNV